MSPGVRVDQMSHTVSKFLVTGSYGIRDWLKISMFHIIVPLCQINTAPSDDCVFKSIKSLLPSVFFYVCYGNLELKMAKLW